jgi:hypothetical protein
MDARCTTWLETGADSAAAAVLAVAVAFALVTFGLGSATAGIAALAVLAASLLALRSVPLAPPQFTLAAFALEPMPVPEAIDELILTEADRLQQPEPSPAAEELLLDDVLAELEDSSRVVRLFDRATMPTAEEMKARIDRHLDGSRSSSSDASQALHDALSELRRTLR